MIHSKLAHSSFHTLVVANLLVLAVNYWRRTHANCSLGHLKSRRVQRQVCQNYHRREFTSALDFISRVKPRVAGIFAAIIINFSEKETGRMAPSKHCYYEWFLCAMVYGFRISTVSGLLAGRSGFYGSIPGGDWKYFSLLPCPERLWAPPSLLSNGYKGFFPWA
jgi:hypothetical protein